MIFDTHVLHMYCRYKSNQCIFKSTYHCHCVICCLRQVRDHPLFSASLQEYREGTRGIEVNPVVYVYAFKNVGLSYCSYLYMKQV